MTPKFAMVFAAGFGTRMRPLTETTPKPLIEVAGLPLLDHALTLVKEARARAVVNAHYLADQIIAHCASREDCTVVHETPDVLDTGGGIKNALPVLGDDPIFALNSDAVWAGTNPLRLLADAWNPEKMDALLMLVPLTLTVGYTRPGSFTRNSDNQISWNETETGEVYTGAQIIKTDILRDHPEDIFSLRVPWNKAIKDGRAYGLSYPGKWADVGTPDGVALAEQMLKDSDV